jgi:hypothetical protein
MRRVGLDGGKRTHVFFIIITKHAPGVTFNSHPQSTPDSSALTRALAALSSPLALSLSLLDLNNSLRARSVRPSLPLERSARSPRTRALSLTLVLSLTLSLALSSLCNSPRSRLVAASSAEVRSRSHAWWAHKVRECIHNKSSQDIHNTPTRTNQTQKREGHSHQHIDVHTRFILESFHTAHHHVLNSREKKCWSSPRRQVTRYLYVFLGN